MLHCLRNDSYIFIIKARFLPKRYDIEEPTQGRIEENELLKEAI